MLWSQGISRALLALEKVLALDLKTASIHTCSSQTSRPYCSQLSPAIRLRAATVSSKIMSYLLYLPVHRSAFLNDFSHAIKLSQLRAALILKSSHSKVM